MTDLVKFRVSAPFILAMMTPTSSELVYGYEHQWIGESDAVAIALAMYDEGSAPAVVEDIALLLGDEQWRVSDLIEQLKSSLSTSDDPVQAWLFITLAWIYGNKTEFIDPYETIEMLYADFGYPSSIEGLVRFLPPSPGEAYGMSSLDDRWKGIPRFRAGPVWGTLSRCRTIILIPGLRPNFESRK